MEVHTQTVWSLSILPLISCIWFHAILENRVKGKNLPFEEKEVFLLQKWGVKKKKRNLIYAFYVQIHLIFLN